MDYAREESLYWHNIRFWIECDRPDSGIIFDIMKKCSRSVYHNLLRSMKKQRDDKIRVAISKETLQSSKDTYWSQVNSIRKNTFNTTSVIDGHTGDMNIANHFQNKFSHLYNSVPTATMKLNSLSECISSKITLTELCSI